MKRLDNKGFTLVELIATIVVLSLVMGIGAYSITGLIENSKQKDYDLLIEEIKTATELYYQECRYVTKKCSNSGEITLGDLLNSGFLKENGELSKENKLILINPLDNGEITNCRVGYEYKNGEFNLMVIDPSGSCPDSY